MRDTEAYHSLPAKVAQWVLKQVDHDWVDFFATNKAKKITPNTFTGSFYVVEVVYERQLLPAELNPDWVAGMDIGLDVLTALTSNKPGFQPLVVNGSPMKSINQFYNKRKAELRSRLKGDKKISHRIKKITNKRNQRVWHYIHVASRQIVEYLVQEKISVLAIGKK
jgi:putative transposase